MKSTNFKLVRYDADDGKVFDWADLSDHIVIDADGNKIQEHLYTKTIFIGNYDNINNYIEVDAPEEEG